MSEEKRDIHSGWIVKQVSDSEFYVKESSRKELSTEIERLRASLAAKDAEIERLRADILVAINEFDYGDSISLISMIATLRELGGEQ